MSGDVSLGACIPLSDLTVDVKSVRYNYTPGPNPSLPVQFSDTSYLLMLYSSAYTDFLLIL